MDLIGLCRWSEMVDGLCRRDTADESAHLPGALKTSFVAFRRPVYIYIDMLCQCRPELEWQSTQCALVQACASFFGVRAGHPAELVEVGLRALRQL